jgi:DNA-binding NarL/FixJ family response regulator
MSEARRQRVVMLANHGLAIREIARQLHIAKSTVFDIIRRRPAGGGGA